MRKIKAQQMNYIKRSLCAVLAALFILGGIPRVSAYTPDWYPFGNTPFEYFLEFIFSTLDKTVFSGREVKDIVQAATPQATVKFEGGRLLYNYKDSLSIQIGEYIFSRYFFGSQIFAQDIQGYTLYIPFFIYKGDFYIEGTDVWNNIDNGYNIYTEGVNAYARGVTVDTWVPISELFSGFVINRRTFYSTQLYHVGGYSPPPGYQERGYINISEWLRLNEENGGIVNKPVYTFNEITGMDSIDYITDNLHSFKPGELGIGVFTVPPSFYNVNGIWFWDYLATLQPHELYTQQPEEEIEVELVLPDELRDLGDDDIVEFHIDDEGNVTIIVTRADGSVGPGGGSCHCDICKPDYSGILGFMQQILDELNKIPGAIAEIPAQIKQEFDGFSAGIGKILYDSSTEAEYNDAGELTGGGGILSGVVTFFKNPLKAVGKILTNLFLPRESFLNEQINILETQFNAKIPALGKAREIIDEFRILSNVDDSQSFWGPAPLEDDEIEDEPYGYDDDAFDLNPWADMSSLEDTFFSADGRYAGNFIEYVRRWYRPYRTQIHAIIIAFAYLVFARNFIKKAPTFFNGGDYKN